MKKRLLSALVVLQIAVLFLCASGLGADFPMTIADSAGRDVTLQMPVERIIVLSTDAAEAVKLLGAEDKIVGVVDTVQKMSWYFPNLKNKALVGKWSAPDYEAIAQIAKGSGDTIIPDILVIGYPSGTMGGKSYGVDAVSEGLASFKDIAVVGFDFSKDATMDEEIAKLGKILDKDDKAQQYIGWKTAKKETVVDAVKGKDMPKVYFETSAPKGLGELKTNGGGAEINKNIRLAGGLNVFGASPDQSVTTNWEAVIAKKPDIILQAKSDDMLGWGAFPSTDTVAAQNVRNEILARTGGSAVPAVKDDKVWILYRNMLYGPDSIVGAAFMAKLFHPEINLDPVGIYKEYLALLDVTYPQDRTFVFPELTSE